MVTLTLARRAARRLSAERGDAAIERVRKLTGESMTTAFGVAAVGCVVGAVEVPHDVVVPITTMIFRNVVLPRRVALARKYIPEVPLDVLDAYRAMDERRAIKSVIRISLT